MIDITGQGIKSHIISTSCTVVSHPYLDTVDLNPVIDPNQLLSYGASYRKVKSGEVIFMEGSVLNYYFQLVSGSVHWINLSDDGREFLQNIILPGESFGELGLFDDLPYSATAMAVEDSLLIRLPKSVFLQLVKENPQVHLAITKALTLRMRYEFLMLKENAFHDPARRLQVLLNYFKESGRHFCSYCNKVTLTRQQLADMTGLRVETVIRTIKSLEAQGLLSILKGKVYYTA